MPMFSIWPPSERLSQARSSDIPNPVISRIRQRNPGDLNDDVRSGCKIQKPRRRLRNVNSAVSVGMEPSPIWEDAAAPEMAITVARSGGKSLVFHFAVG